MGWRGKDGCGCEEDRDEIFAKRHAVASGSGEKVRDERTQVVGDGAGRFADTHAAAVLIDHPEAEDRVTVLEYDFGSQGLDNLVASVGSVGRGDGGVVPDHGDVGTLAGVEGLADIVAQRSRGRVEMSFEE